MSSNFKRICPAARKWCVGYTGPGRPEALIESRVDRFIGELAIGNEVWF